MCAEKFLGCILQIKTKPDPIVKNVIGTLRSIDTTTPTQTIVLDDVIVNGEVLNDGFLLRSTEIADLQVIAKKAEEPKILQKEEKEKQDGGHFFIQNDLNGGNACVPQQQRPKQQPQQQAQKIFPTKKLQPQQQQQQQQNRRGNHGNNKETFELIDPVDMDTEFDFEKSNLLFEKLPVTIRKPAPPPPAAPTTIQPPPLQTPFALSSILEKLTMTTTTAKSIATTTTLQHDTTTTAERFIPSTVVKNNNSSTKFNRCLVTDTGVAIPTVDLPTRSHVLNMASRLGLDHGRTVEAMARAVVEIAIPLLGDSFLLSPERDERERPCVVVVVGANWHGAVGIATARLLATLAVKTFVISPKTELSLVAKEEALYLLTGNFFSRDINDLPHGNNQYYPLAILAYDDHLSTTLTTSLYGNAIESIPNRIYVDPPKSSRFHGDLENNKKKNSIIKTSIICPCLPLDYENGVDSNNVKIYVVNLGVPEGVWSEVGITWKSFHGGKLVTRGWVK